MEIAESESERFWAKVAKATEITSPHVTSPCWNWTGSTNGRGYGQMSFRNGSPAKAHRIAWMASNGDIPAGLCVLHRCDNPRCVRADHLFLGTIADNNADKETKGRGGGNEPRRGDDHYARTNPERLARGDRHGSRLHPERRPRGDGHHSALRPETVARGERACAAKLTADHVIAIRTRAAAGEPVKALALEYGITRENAYMVVSRKSWAHVKEPILSGPMIPPRVQRGVARSPERVVRGENNGKSKLNAASVADIRKRASEGLPLKTLAVEYGIHASTISGIIRGLTWKHIP